MRFLEDSRVQGEWLHVGRWLCSVCLKTFRHLPPFLYFRKRYMTGVIEAVAASVLVRKRQPYRKAVAQPPPNRIPLIYECGNGSRMSPSSCWRWITWMASLTLAILSQQPAVATESSKSRSELDLFSFAPQQARSVERLVELQHARRFHLSGRMKDPLDHRQRHLAF